KRRRWRRRKEEVTSGVRCGGTEEVLGGEQGELREMSIAHRSVQVVVFDKETISVVGGVSYDRRIGIHLLVFMYSMQ
ncbi:hypothetical protein LINPERPRIM_LOCUS12030, partial [Linum perenne]